MLPSHSPPAAPRPGSGRTLATGLCFPCSLASPPAPSPQEAPSWSCLCLGATGGALPQGLQACCVSSLVVNPLCHCPSIPEGQTRCHPFNCPMETAFPGRPRALWRRAQWGCSMSWLQGRPDSPPGSPCLQETRIPGTTGRPVEGIRRRRSSFPVLYSEHL